MRAMRTLPPNAIEGASPARGGALEGVLTTDDEVVVAYCDLARRAQIIRLAAPNNRLLPAFLLAEHA